MRVRLVFGMVVVSLSVGTPVARAAAEERYVSLGDSFVAGPLIPAVRPGSPLGCLRSDHDYPSLVAAGLKVAAFTDASCSGATTTDMTTAQHTRLGTNAPQLNALTSRTTLVTLGIGGNDIGFADVVLSCGLFGLFDPAGAPCATRFGRGLDRRIAATGPKVAAVLRGIHERSPQARVVVVGYLRLLPSGRGCWPRVPLGAGDTAYLDTAERHLNAMLAGQARAGGAAFVDTYAGGDGHDMCAAEARRWVEGLVPRSPAAPIHPNAHGMREVANRVLAALTT